MSTLSDVQEILAAHLPAGSQLVMNANAQRPLSAAELDQLQGVERDCVMGAPTRQRDFVRGRLTAHQALRKFGVAAQSGIGIADSRAPLWPKGLVGSISHCEEAVAVVVAPSQALRGVGIDVEAEQELQPGVIGAVLRSDEISPHRCSDAGRAMSVDESARPLIQFSAKEALFKLWEPIMGTWLDFSEVSVRVERGHADWPLGPEIGPLRFTFHRRVAHDFRRVKGIWVRGGKVVTTVAWLEAPAESSESTEPTVSRVGRRTRFWRGHRIR